MTHCLISKIVPFVPQFEVIKLNSDGKTLKTLYTKGTQVFFQNGIDDLGNGFSAEEGFLWNK